MRARAFLGRNPAPSGLGKHFKEVAGGAVWAAVVVMVAVAGSTTVIADQPIRTSELPATLGIAEPVEGKGGREPGVPGFSAFAPGLVSPRSGVAGPAPEGYEFYFTRAIYSGRRGWGWGGRGSWSTDYPKADRQFLVVIKRLVGLDAYDFENAIDLADPDIRRFPFLYALEVGRMALTDDEVHGLRDYLDAGGFLVIDDFWGTQEWDAFEYNIRRVLPGREIVTLPLDHELFRAFYEITEIKQVPNVRQGRYGGPTWERDGYEPRVLGIFDDDGQLMVVINWNTDLGDAWEWAEDPFYPLEYSTFAYEMGANMIVYGMSH